MMSDLYLIFLALAATLFAVIVFYSYWQQRRGDGKQSMVERSDPLLDKTDTLKSSSSQKSDSGKGVKSAASYKRAGGSKGSADNTVAPRSAGLADVTPLQKRATEDVIGKPQTEANSTAIVTELVARIKNPDPIEQQDLLMMFRKHDFKFHRRVHIYGLNQLTDMWRDIEFELPSAQFVELGVAIQLADREGAMSKKELHDFQQMTLEFSNSYNAPFEFSMDVDGALKQAKILDQIGRRYDYMAVINVVPRRKAGFRAADIESCARDLQMSADKHGIFLKTKGQRHNLSVLYRLACTDGTGHIGIPNSTSPIHELVIYMNVPAISEPDLVFREMAEDANNLATWLDGKVVDRKSKVMTQRSYTALSQQISDIAYKMQRDGLTPGDQVSKKLF